MESPYPILTLATVLLNSPPNQMFCPQFLDLLLLFRMFGFPNHRGGDVEAISYVFNGDWVDRGAHQATPPTFLPSISLRPLLPARVLCIVMQSLHPPHHALRSPHSRPSLF